MNNKNMIGLMKLNNRIAETLADKSMKPAERLKLIERLNLEAASLLVKMTREGN